MAANASGLVLRSLLQLDHGLDHQLPASCVGCSACGHSSLQLEREIIDKQSNSLNAVIRINSDSGTQKQQTCRTRIIVHK
jgi:hypothetical protein